MSVMAALVFALVLAFGYALSLWLNRPRLRSTSGSLPRRGESSERRARLELLLAASVLMGVTFLAISGAGTRITARSIADWWRSVPTIDSRFQHYVCDTALNEERTQWETKGGWKRVVAWGAKNRIPLDACRIALGMSGLYRVSGTGADGKSYSGMLALAGSGDQVRLTRWIGGQILRGTGTVGPTLKVYWGNNHFAVYRFGAGGRLEGQWKDGTTQKETLEIFSAAASSPARSLHNRYRCVGQNPDGSGYWGKVLIEKHMLYYNVQWEVGGTIARGTGRLEDNLLTVQWGGSTPAVFAVQTNGKLIGLWDEGKGEETMWPVQ
jgi:hypothetical protein